MLGEEVVGAAVQAVAGQQVVAGAQQAQQGGGDRRHPGGGRDRGLAALQRRQPRVQIQLRRRRAQAVVADVVVVGAGLDRVHGALVDGIHERPVGARATLVAVDRDGLDRGLVIWAHGPLHASRGAATAAPRARGRPLGVRTAGERVRAADGPRSVEASAMPGVPAAATRRSPTRPRAAHGADSSAGRRPPRGVRSPSGPSVVRSSAVESRWGLDRPPATKTGERHPRKPTLPGVLQADVIAASAPRATRSRRKPARIPPRLSSVSRGAGPGPAAERVAGATSRLRGDDRGRLGHQRRRARSRRRSGWPGRRRAGSGVPAAPAGVRRRGRRRRWCRAGRRRPRRRARASGRRRSRPGQRPSPE